MKLKLIPHKGMSKASSTTFPWKSCLPFVDNKRGQLIHRPRSVATFTQFGYPYIAVHYWCGSTSCGEDKFTFLEDPTPTEKLLCTRCESIAVENGLPSADELLGKHIHQGKLIPVQTCHTKMSLKDQIKQAQEEMAKWPPDVRAACQLEGSE